MRLIPTFLQTPRAVTLLLGDTLLAIEIMKCHLFLGDYCAGGPPLPIPNREVKPRSADGTAIMVEE